MDLQTHSTGENKSSQSQFVTLLKDDPSFQAYLDGHGPQGALVLPVESFAIQSERERVTFRIVDGPRKSFFKKWVSSLRLARPELMGLTVLPGLLALITIFELGGHFEMWRALSALTCLWALHVSAFARNDYDDHRFGIDRVQRTRGSQMIQSGRLAAFEVKRISYVALFCAAVLALPVLQIANSLVWVLVAVGLISVLTYSFAGRGFKNQGAGDFVAALCFGPLITFGFGALWLKTHPVEMFLVGLPLGLLAMISFQLRHLETLIAERNAKSGTLMARLGFDRAKKWIMNESRLLTLCAGVALAPLLEAEELVVVVGLFFAFQLWISNRLRRAASPLSSVLVGLPRRVVTSHFFLSIGLIVIIYFGHRFATP